MSEHFSPLVEPLVEQCRQKANKDGTYAVAVALFEIAKSLDNLGFGTTDHPGAIEGYTMKMMESLSDLSSSISSISRSLDSIATAIEEKESAS